MFKSRRMRRIAQIALIVALLIVFVGYPLVSVLAYNFVSLVSVKAPVVAPSSEYENVTFPSRGQNYEVHAFYMPGTAGRPALIQIHGWKGSRFDTNNIARAEKMQAVGYTVLSIDLSDSRGETVGNGRIAMGFEERYDALGAFDYLLSKGFAPDKIGLVGESMGGATSLMAAAMEPRIRAVWADSPYGRVDIVSAEQAETYGFPRFVVPGGLFVGSLITGHRIWEEAPVDSGKQIAANKQAIQLAHCDKDDFVFYHHSLDIEAAYKAANVEIGLWSPVCTKHASAFPAYTDEYIKRLDDFFRVHLGS